MEHREDTEGRELMQKVVTLTGLPEKWVEQELDQILEKNGCSSESLTLQDLRDSLVAYLENLYLENISLENINEMNSSEAGTLSLKQ